MSGPLFFEYPDGTVQINFNYRSRIGLDNSYYLMYKKSLTQELKQEINSRLQELWKMNKQDLIQLVRDREEKEIYDLFGIKEMVNGWFLSKWGERERVRQKEAKLHNAILKFDWWMDKYQKQKQEDKKWELYQLKCGAIEGGQFMRLGVLEDQSKKRLRRSFSSTSLNTPQKMEEYPFFLERCGLGKPVKIKVPEFMNLKKTRYVPRMDKIKRGGI